LLEYSRWGRRKKEPSSVPLTLIASILSTRRAKQSGNFLARNLGVYMYTSGVSRRVIDCYRTILRTVQGIAVNTEKNLLRLKAKDNLYMAYNNSSIWSESAIKS